MSKNVIADGTKTSPALRVGLFAILLFLIILMSPVITGLFEGTEAYALVATGLFFLSLGLMYFLPLIFVKWEGGSSVAELGLDIEDKDLFPQVLIGIVAGGLAATLVIAIAFFFGGDLRPGSEITVDLLLNEIIITVPVAIFEELSYRGYLTTRMVDLVGKGGGIILSSLFFGLLHFSWWIPLGTVPPHLILLFTLNLTLGGIILSLSYYWSGNKLWVPIGFHFMWNMLAYILFPTYPIDPVISPEIFQIEWGLTTIAGFLFGLTVLWMLLDYWKRKK